jgi:uncharacterized membrane protein
MAAMVVERTVRRIVGTWLAGLVVLLPVALTLAILAWLFGLVYRLVGPGTLIGRVFAAVGYPFSNNPGLAYLFGTLVLFAAIYLLGLLVQLGLKRPLSWLLDSTVRRIPLVGDLYALADRFVGLLHNRQAADVGAMSPVWCFFGGGGAAVLALAPNPEPLKIDGRDYVALLVPTAPVPFGGALMYVPSDWVRPADIGVERLTAVYVSMGITAPPAPRASGDARPA